MIRLLFPLLFISACATKISISEVKNSIISTHPAACKKEALKFIQSQHNFLKLLFEQSREPYYGLNKWSEECLRGNIIGRVMEKDSHIFMNSALYLNSDLEPGFCPENGANHWNVVLVYCDGDKEVKQYKIPFQDSILKGQFNPCPD